MTGVDQALATLQGRLILDLECRVIRLQAEVNLLREELAKADRDLAAARHLFQGVTVTEDDGEY